MLRLLSLLAPVSATSTATASRAVGSHSSVGAAAAAPGPVSVRQFGAKCDGVTDDTAAIQTALHCGATAIYSPEGDCVIKGNLHAKWGGSMLRIFGDGAGEAPGGAQGSVWTLTGSGALLTYDGASTLTGFQLESIKLRSVNKSPAVPTFGLNLSHSFVNHIRHVRFEGFGDLGFPPSTAAAAAAAVPSAGLLLSGVYTNTVVTNVFACSFTHNTMGIYSPMENMNMLNVDDSYFYTNGWGIRGGDLQGNPVYFTKWSVRGCNLEGNTLGDLYITGGARGLTYTDNYHEMIPHRPFVVIGSPSIHPLRALSRV